jgi:hypothetical protein
LERFTARRRAAKIAAEGGSIGMLQWFSSRDDEQASPRDADSPASPDLADLNESECEAHCLYPPPGVG